VTADVGLGSGLLFRQRGELRAFDCGVGCCGASAGGAERGAKEVEAEALVGFLVAAPDLQRQQQQ
jgi:hypothetical protein